MNHEEYEKRCAATAISCGPSKTKQADGPLCNINEIVKRYRNTGQLTHVRTEIAQYGDFSPVVDFHGALVQLRKAEAAFERLPARVRRRFLNDPGELLDFVADEENYDEALELGLVEERQAAPTVDVRVVESVTKGVTVVEDSSTESEGENP